MAFDLDVSLLPSVSSIIIIIAVIAGWFVGLRKINKDKEIDRELLANIVKEEMEAS